VLFNFPVIFRKFLELSALYLGFVSHPGSILNYGTTTKEIAVMRNERMKRILPYIALFLILPWPVAYATSADVVAGEEAVTINAAEPSAQPSFTAYGRAIGGINNPGDLFYVDATNSTSDIKITLYLINAQQLVKYYRYLILDVGIYVEKGTGEWERATASNSNGEPVPKTIISMQNGQVSFLLPGNSRYRVAIDSGCFYCASAGADSYFLSPQFCLEAI